MIPGVVLLTLALGLASCHPGSVLSSLKKGQPHTTSHRERVGIFDGSNATIEQFPYMAGIVYHRTHLLEAGVILNEHWILSVATYIYNYDTHHLTVVTGSSDGVVGTSYKVKKMVIHPDYSFSTMDYDYVLLKVKGTLSWSDKVGNVSLPSSQPAVDTELSIAGWGSTGYRSDSEDGKTALQQGTMSWFSFKKCKKMYKDFVDLMFTSRWGCVYNKGNTTICNNDFGDPLVKDGVLYGLAKDGGAEGWCTSEALPVIVANIYPAVDWIKNTTGLSQ